MCQMLTHWGRVTHICVSKLTIIGSDNGLSRDGHQAIKWTNAGILLIWPIGTTFCEILLEIHFPRYRPFVRGIHRSLVNSLMFSLICAWTNDWANHRDASDLRRHRAHYDVTVMRKGLWTLTPSRNGRHFADIFTFLEWKMLYFDPKDTINNKPALTTFR